MSGSRLVRASVAALMIVSSAVPTVARELEFPLCVPRDKARAPAQAQHVVPPDGAVAAVIRPFELVARTTGHMADITLGRPAHAPEQRAAFLAVVMPVVDALVAEGVNEHVSVAMEGR